MSHLNIVHVTSPPLPPNGYKGGGGGGMEKGDQRGRNEIFVAIYFVESQDLSIDVVCGNNPTFLVTKI